MYLIHQAYEWASKIQVEELHLQELGIASLSAMFANTNRGKDAPAFQEKDFYHFNTNTEAKIPSAAADAFFSLAEELKLPAWAISIAPIPKLLAHRGKGDFAYPRAWIGEGIVLLQPLIRGSKVVCQMAIVESVRGECNVQDPDSGLWFTIVVPDGEPRWMLDCEFERLS
jgi:hypothetical protein